MALFGNKSGRIAAGMAFFSRLGNGASASTGVSGHRQPAAGRQKLPTRLLGRAWKTQRSKLALKAGFSILKPRRITKPNIQFVDRRQLL